jgi:hypothetical protein
MAELAQPGLFREFCQPRNRCGSAVLRRTPLPWIGIQGWVLRNANHVFQINSDAEPRNPDALTGAPSAERQPDTRVTL